MTWQGQRVLAVCPARGGSKGIKLKNLIEINGVSLVARVGHLCRQLPWLDRAVVSTDHPEVMAAAQSSGLDAPFTRPPEISGDRIGDADVLAHALRATEADDGMHYDIVVMLQPTSPLRRVEHVTQTMTAFSDGEWDAAWTLSMTDSKSHPYKQLVLGEDEALAFYDQAGAGVVARQQLEPVYHRNGIAYVMTRPCLLEGGKIWGARTRAVVVEGDFVSIDTMWDVDLVAYIMGRQGDPLDVDPQVPEAL